MSFANRRVRESAFSGWLVTLLLLVLAIKLNVGYSSAGTQIYSIFNTNSKDTARITHLISERSLHRQLPRLRTAYRSQKKSSILAAGTKRDVEAQSGCIIAPQRPFCSRLSHEVCTRFFVQHGVSTNFTRASPAELNDFTCKAGPGTWHIRQFSKSLDKIPARHKKHAAAYSI